MMPTREVYWNIDHIWLMYVLLGPTILVFCYGWYRRYKLWRMGQSDINRRQQVKQRLIAFVVYVLGHKRMVRESYSGWSHFLLFSGFIVLFIATLVVMVHQDFRLHIMQGAFYLVFQSFIVDVFGFLAIMGTLMLMGRRYVSKLNRLHYNTPERPGARRQKAWEDATLLLLILLILITGFLLEGLRIAVTHDPWGRWSPVGWVLAGGIEKWLPIEAMRSAHRFLWWFHMAIVYGFIAWLPYTKLAHIFASAANVYFRSLEPAGAMLKPVDIEASERLGTAWIEDFTWKDLLDLDACTECGRCQQECPATATAKPLSPKTLILDLREALHRRAGQGTGEGAGSLVGTFIREETLWSCTTCMACMEACPVFIEHIPKIVNMRRYLVMEEARCPDLMADALKSLQDRGHPFRGTTSSRTDWCQDLSVAHISEVANPDYLLWVGCASALNDRNQRVVRALARLLDRAGIRYGILGQHERCVGDPARRIGHEYLFEQIVRENIRQLDRYRVRRIVTPCPHCFNCFRHEYPQFGGHYEVVHHSQLLAELVSEGRLTPEPIISKRITYHDPCYLGRYNGLYEEPRRVIRAGATGGIREMKACREKAFCCGAGGGLMWTEELGTRINHERVTHALETGVDIVAVSCPFCMIMLEDGAKAKADERSMQVLDIAEILSQALIQPERGS